MRIHSGTTSDPARLPLEGTDVSWDPHVHVLRTGFHVPKKLYIMPRTWGAHRYPPPVPPVPTHRTTAHAVGGTWAARRTKAPASPHPNAAPTQHASLVPFRVMGACVAAIRRRRLHTSTFHVAGQPQKPPLQSTLACRWIQALNAYLTETAFPTAPCAASARCHYVPVDKPTQPDIRCLHRKPI